VRVDSITRVAQFTALLNFFTSHQGIDRGLPVNGSLRVLGFFSNPYASRCVSCWLLGGGGKLSRMGDRKSGFCPSISFLVGGLREPLRMSIKALWTQASRPTKGSAIGAATPEREKGQADCNFY
jgi:hypothetical protein